MEDPLHYMPVERWGELQEVFKCDWPRFVSGYYLLETQKQWRLQGIDYDFHVYCPYGDVSSGMVALNKPSFEVIVISPLNEPTLLERALRTTKLIDWNQPLTAIPFAAPNIIQLCRRIAPSHKEMLFTECNRFILGRDKPQFEVRLPEELSFKLLTSGNSDAELINGKWPHRYSGSVSLFKTLINNKCGYGLYMNNELVSWIFTSEHGHLLHLFTLEEHRKRGYADVLMKLICNLIREDRGVVFSYIVKGNEKSIRLFLRLGFSVADDVAWCRYCEICTMKE